MRDVRVIVAGVAAMTVAAVLPVWAAAHGSDLRVAFGSLRHGWIAGIPPDTRSESRIVGRIDGHQVAIAPTRNGNYCRAFAGLFAGCRVRSAGVIGATVIGSHGRMTMLAGDVVATGGQLYVSFDQGAARPVRVVWVSSPIAAGFFVVNVPRGVKTASMILRLQGRNVARAGDLRIHLPATHP